MSRSYREIGHVFSFFSGIAKVEGLAHVFLHEVLIDKRGNEQGLVIGFDKKFVELLLFDEKFDTRQPLFRSQRIFSVPPRGCLGRVLDGLGKPLDGLAALGGKLQPVFRPAPSIMEREPISVPLLTGVEIIDAVLPIGRGQRELIIGDRKLGKSTLAEDAVLSQKTAQPPVYCVYVLCGQKRRQLRRMVEFFRKKDAFSYTVVVAAPADDSFAAQYLAPFVGCALGEYFRDQGKDSLIIYDDLSRHAKIYRDIALLLDRAPGREAYPGDIFSLHAGLLERAAKIKGGGSLTALPLVETEEGDITSFIPTNLISITDGQIYLDRSLYQKGFLPAINIGLSVSRVGAAVQPKPLREATSALRLSLAQYREEEKLTQLESEVNLETEKRIRRGKLILAFLKQDKHRLVSWESQTVVFYALREGLFDGLAERQFIQGIGIFLEFLANRYPEILTAIGKGDFRQAVKTKIKALVNEFKKEFLSISP